MSIEMTKYVLQSHDQFNSHMMCLSDLMNHVIKKLVWSCELLCNGLEVILLNCFG